MRPRGWALGENAAPLARTSASCTGPYRLGGLWSGHGTLGLGCDATGHKEDHRERRRERPPATGLRCPFRALVGQFRETSGRARGTRRRGRRLGGARGAGAGAGQRGVHWGSRAARSAPFPHLWWVTPGLISAASRHYSNSIACPKRAAGKPTRVGMVRTPFGLASPRPQPAEARPAQGPDPEAGLTALRLDRPPGPFPSPCASAGAYVPRQNRRGKPRPASAGPAPCQQPSCSCRDTAHRSACLSRRGALLHPVVETGSFCLRSKGRRLVQA